uniref:Uncharacterized protein n=1 Tax=Avena sativa TaxID=4498 RepID=A0ACD5ZF49_AVESA
MEIPTSGSRPIRGATGPADQPQPLVRVGVLSPVQRKRSIVHTHMAMLDAATGVPAGHRKGAVGINQSRGRDYTARVDFKYATSRGEAYHAATTGHDHPLLEEGASATSSCWTEAAATCDLRARMCGGEGGKAICALCGAGADVHCAADAAFLCAACDAEVHGANILASRHRRTRVSAPNKAEQGLDGGVSGSAPSSCLSTDDSATTAAPRQRGRRTRPRRARRGRGEAVLLGWANQMGIVAPGAARQHALAATCALQDVAAAPRVPMRVAMAAALWREVTVHSVYEAGGGALRQLEACARVPARLIVTVASSMGSACVKRAPPVDTEEGWGECS